MKKLLSVFFSLILVATLSACGGSDTAAPAASSKTETAAPAEKAAPTAPAAATKEPVEAAAPVEKETTPTPAPAAQPAAPASAPVPAAEAAEEGNQAPAEKAKGAPKMVSPEPVYQFGEMDNNKKVEHAFIVRNDGDATLNISRVKTSCGCTVAQPEKKVLAPGEATKVNATLSLRGRQGKVTKSITVYSDDPETPSFVLKFEGTAIAAIHMEPARLSFGRVMDNEVHTRKVNIRAQKEEITFHITKVEYSKLDGIKAEVETVTDGKEYNVTVQNEGPFPTGNLSGRIMLHTDYPARPVLYLNVFAQVIGVLEVAPPSISIRVSDDETRTTSQYIRVSSGRVQEFEIADIIVPVDSMTAEIKPRKDRNKEDIKNDYLIYLKNMPMTEALEGKSLTLVLTDAEKTKVDIPFQIVKMNKKNLVPLKRQIAPAKPKAATAAPDAAATAPATAAPKAAAPSAPTVEKK